MIFAAIFGGGIASVVTAILLTGGWTLTAQNACGYAAIYSQPAAFFLVVAIWPWVCEMDERRSK
jgi:hypothetical protein